MNSIGLKTADRQRLEQRRQAASRLHPRQLHHTRGTMLRAVAARRGRGRIVLYWHVSSVVLHSVWNLTAGLRG